MARLEEFLPDGRVRIAVAGQHMVVDSTDVDRANPVRFDRVADSAALPFLNETATIHLLRQRLDIPLFLFRKPLQIWRESVVHKRGIPVGHLPEQCRWLDPLGRPARQSFQGVSTRAYPFSHLRHGPASIQVGRGGEKARENSPGIYR